MYLKRKYVQNALLFKSILNLWIDIELIEKYETYFINIIKCLIKYFSKVTENLRELNILPKFKNIKHFSKFNGHHVFA